MLFGTYTVLHFGFLYRATGIGRAASGYNYY